MSEKMLLSRRKTRVVIIVCTILLAAIIPVYAWYVDMSRLSRTGEMEIDMPPIIYIRDNNLEEVTSFQLDGLKKGEEYNEVFCVSPALIGSVKNFFLGVIYTENLGMEIGIYPVGTITAEKPTGEGALCVEKEVTLSDGTNGTCYFPGSTWPDGAVNRTTYGGWTDANKPEEANLNCGVYKSYSGVGFTDVQPEPEDLIGKLNDTRRYRFFILKITWNETEAGMENDKENSNSKEADIVYIVTKGIQEKDEKAT